jgi:hypothetical protein
VGKNLKYFLKTPFLKIHPARDLRKILNEFCKYMKYIMTIIYIKYMRYITNIGYTKKYK